MTSEWQIAANRRNAGSSTGPRSERGRARAARNALRNGLDSVVFDKGQPSEQIGKIARLIAGNASNGILYEQALIIAESWLVISRIRIFRIKAIERFRAQLQSHFFPGSPLPQEIEGITRLYGLGNHQEIKNIIRRWAKASV